jgi:hypothetical protein
MFQISRRISALLLLCLFAIVVFDPSDSLTGLKKHVFLTLLSWWFLLQVGTKRPPPIVPATLLIFICFGLLLPFLSIISYYLQGGDFLEYDGFKTLVGFLSLGLLIVISSLEVSALHLFVVILNVQALVTVGLYIFLSLNPAFIEPITLFGYEQGFLWINPKDYSGIKFLQIFFKTSPFMVLSAAYYSAKYFTPSRDRNGFALLLLSASCLALLISGTRANMAFAVIIPGYFAIRNLKWASLPSKFFTIVVLGVLLGLVAANIDILAAMLDPNETSNAVKLGYWDDYIQIFSDPIVFLFGQGIGVVHYFDSLGLELRITEVSLMELVRNFGVLMAIAYCFFWIAPLFMLRRAGFYDRHWLWVAYASYLLISMTNYFILSSSGMVLISIIYSECLKSRRLSNFSNERRSTAANFSIHRNAIN